MIVSIRVFDCEYSRIRLRVLASTGEIDWEYLRVRLRVLACTIASTRVYNCEYSRVRLWVLTSILEFRAHEFRLACGQGIAHVRSFTLAFGTCVLYCEWYESLTLACKLAAERHCRLTLRNVKKLEQSKKDRIKWGWRMPISVFLYVWAYSSDAAPPAKRLRSILGMMHDYKCVWCYKKWLAKHPESKLFLCLHDHAWAAFKSHTVALEDQIMWNRIDCLIDSAADQPYTLEIRSHHKC